MFITTIIYKSKDLVIYRIKITRMYRL